MSSRSIPDVSAGWLFDPTQPAAIALDSAAWGAWLADPATTRFTYPLHDRRAGYISGFMTVRKEGRQRGGTYWSVYRRLGGRLRKLYLGPAAAVTATRLEAIAQALLAEATARTEEGTMDER
jgi:hypothetical protein